eukprot:TRINITY_DN23195_c0_g1_i11.p1 TRINITY_DN23195_c0_g1~~TRINITY_DN23195_c0_g1_i11.p1  ORF type:complete len:232 (+),score=27.60 TRINITY_DN23195_c0_g1_i11:117-812(+)
MAGRPTMQPPVHKMDSSVISSNNPRANRAHAIRFSTESRSSLQQCRSHAHRSVAGARPRRVDAMDFSAIVKRLNLQPLNSDSDTGSDSDSSAADDQKQQRVDAMAFSRTSGRLNSQQCHRSVAGARPRRVDAMDFSAIVKRLNLQPLNSDSNTGPDADTSAADNQRLHQVVATDSKIGRRSNSQKYRPLTQVLYGQSDSQKVRDSSEDPTAEGDLLQIEEHGAIAQARISQ